MAQISRPQINLLRNEMFRLFKNIPEPQRELWDFFTYEVDIDYWDLTTESTLIRSQLAEVLSKLSAGQIGRLLDALQQKYPSDDGLQGVAEQLRPVIGPLPDSAAADRLRKLQSAGLLLDGLAFVNRSRLREILAEISDDNAARVAVVTGASLCGKSWSHHLIRSHCRRTVACARPILLDMQRIQPGNDPSIVWSDLLRRLMPGRPVPSPPTEDTKRGQYAMRLAEEVCVQWDTWWDDRELEEKPWPLVVFDHLEKNAAAAVGPAVVDFTEALAIAAVEQRFQGARLLLLGFPRRFVSAPELDVEVVAPRETVEPLTRAEITRYLDDVAHAIGRAPPALVMETAMQLLAEADAMPRAQDRRAKLMVMSSTLGRHVAALAKALP